MSNPGDQGLVDAMRTAGKLEMTRSDLEKMFGDSIPMEAFHYLDDNQSTDSKPLEAMARLWKSRQKTALYPHLQAPYRSEGSLILMNGSPLCVVEQDKLAYELTVLLNLGHEEFLNRAKRDAHLQADKEWSNNHDHD